MERERLCCTLLKSYLYTRCLDRLCSTLKEYAKVKYNRNLRFYVPTHSLINYTQWRIVSPESRLLDVPAIDGYIAQIWTGTSRTKNVYQGCRVVASLLHPNVYRFEVAPWPNRIFNRQYPKETGIGKEGIPSDYATVLLIVMNTLRNMNQSDINWGDDNLTVGLLLADSGMFQRYYPSNNIDDEKNTNQQGIKEQDIIDWSAFYGLALPLLKHGITVRPVQLDNIRRFPNYLDDYKVLLLSYEFMKPEYPDIHNSLAQWVLDGGILIYVGDDSDPYHHIRAWWNEGKRKYNSPREHLFECMGLKNQFIQQIMNGIEPIQVGKGVFGFLHINPIKLSSDENGANLLRKIVKKTLEKKADSNLKWTTKTILLCS